jgi:F-type H+-transporting ATPase subunit c
MFRKFRNFFALVAFGTLTHPLTLLASDAASGGSGVDYRMGLALASGLGLGIAALGGALGQGKAAQAMLEGISRNPEAGGKMFTPMILCLVFIESLVLFTFAICFLLQNKIG